MLTGNEIVGMYKEAEFYDKRRERLNKAVSSFVDKTRFLWKRGEALDGDETETISKLVLLELDKANGNLSNEEIESREKELREVRI